MHKVFILVPSGATVVTSEDLEHNRHRQSRQELPAACRPLILHAL